MDIDMLLAFGENFVSLTVEAVVIKAVEFHYSDFSVGEKISLVYSIISLLGIEVEEVFFYG